MLTSALFSYNGIMVVHLSLLELLDVRGQYFITFFSHSRIVKQVFIVALLTGSLTAASISTIFLLFDTGFTSLSRFILLDQPLLLSIAASFYSCILFRKEALDSSFNSGEI